MSNIIQLLERMGQDASLQNSASMEQVIEQSELSAELKGVLLNKDTVTLERQLDVCPDVVCIMIPAEDENPDESSEEEPDNDNKIAAVVNG